MKKVMIFPYDKRSEFILKNEYLLKDNIKIDKICYPKGWKIYNKDLIHDYRMSCNYIEDIKDCDLLWIVNSDKNLDFEKNILSLIKEAAVQKKEIVCTRKISEYEKLLIKDFEIKFSLYDDFKNHNDFEIFDIDKPIIFIVSQYDKMDKMNIEFEIRKSFLEKGYRVSQVMSRLEANLFGIKSFDNLFEKNISNKEKILSINHCIKELEVRENSDVIIVGIPGGAMSFSRKVVEDFGEEITLITKSISPDCTIMSFPYYPDVYNYKVFFEYMLEKYNIYVDYFNICNKIIDSSESEIKNKLKYLTVNKDKIEELTKNNNFFYINNKNSINLIVDNVIKQLKHYGKIKMM